MADRLDRRGRVYRRVRLLAVLAEEVPMTGTRKCRECGWEHGQHAWSCSVARAELRFCGIVGLERRIVELEAELAKRKRWSESFSTSGHGWGPV